MFRKTSLILLSILLIFSLASCGVKQSVNDKITEKVAEGIINKAAGGDATVDINKGEYTVKNKDGEKISFGDTKWPDDFAGGKLPELKAGTISASVVTDNSCVIAVEGIELEDYEEYVEKIKDQGYVDDASDLTSEDLHMYSASADDAIIYLQYSSEAKNLTISMELSQ